ncbi:MAG: hypothetical protein Q8Q85_02740 [Gemmatimonadales bacterium]|nr:hypothetical protein [Gemmatimonadales bacterium]
MRLTSSFAVFRYDPGEKDLAKARWYGREGKLAAAEEEYRGALARNPDLMSGWLELFDLMRRSGRHLDALTMAAEAAEHFGPEAAMPLALRGAALAELGQTRDAVRSLERALECDGNLALAWHELAYAAFKAGEYSRALLALDRAFALEPHTDTLMLRGRILREAGQYDAAEVAFEGAQQSAEHDIPRREAEREIAATRRAAALGGKRPRDFTPRESAFAELGCVLLDEGEPDPGSGDDDASPLLARCLSTLPPLARALAWRPTAVAGAQQEDGPLAETIARALGAHTVSAAALDPDDRPLVVTAYNHGTDDWSKQLARLARWRSGYSFALVQAPGVTELADVVGTLRRLGDATAVYAVTARAFAFTAPPPFDAREAVILAAKGSALWQRRVADRL